MKKSALIVLLLFPFLFLAGCKTRPGGLPPAWVDVASAVAYNSAAVGVAMDLQANPNHRAAYQTVDSLLTSMIDRQNWNPADLAAALRLLPVAQLQGPNGILISVALASVFDAATGTLLDVQSPAAVERVGRSIRDGIRAGLQAVPGSARSLPSPVSLPDKARRKTI